MAPFDDDTLRRIISNQSERIEILEYLIEDIYKHGESFKIRDQVVEYFKKYHDKNLSDIF